MKLIRILIIAFLLSSCNKYDLEGEKSVFVGQWKWAYSCGKYSDGGGGGNELYLFADDNIDSYSIEFEENGKIILMKNNENFDRGKAKFSSWYYDNDYNKYSFSIIANKNYTMSGFIWGDTLMLIDDAPSCFPPFNEQNAWRYVNYFVRQ